MKNTLLAMLLFWLFTPFLSSGQNIHGQYLIQIDKYSYYTKIKTQLYSENMDTVINIFIPFQIDTLAELNKNSIATDKKLDTTKPSYDLFMGFIELNYLDTFLNKEITIASNGKTYKIDWLSFSIYRSDGKSNRNNSTTNKMSENEAIIKFLNKSPIDSYIVIDEIWFFSNKRRKEFTIKKVAWKIVKNQ